MKPIQEGSLRRSRECESLGATETGALFPRLHVKETKVSGIRAPPRNKMALFEQFTIPPHRFVPPPVQLPSQPCPGVTAFYVTQGSSYDGRYMCNPCYPNQKIPYNSQHQMAVQSIVTRPMLVTSSSSSSSVVSSSDKEKVEAISGSSVVRARASSSAVTSKALPFDKDGNQSVSKYAKDPAPARSQRKDLCHLPLLKTGAGADVHHCGSDPQNSQPNIDCLLFSVAPYHKDKSLSLCTNSVVAENTSVGVRSTQADVAVENFTDRSSHVSDDGKVQDGGSLMFPAKRNVESALESLSIEGRVSIGLPVESRPPKGQNTVDLIGPSEENHLCINENEDGERKDPAASDGLENERFPKQQVEVNVSFSFLSVETSERAANTDIGGIKEMANVSNQLENNSCGSHMKPSSKRSGEISQSPETKYCSYPEGDSDSISRSSNAMTKLIPKDVIGVIGQREFWKARKQIMLQQKTFSNQVFELHRLMKVQQLIATTPGLLIEEDSESALFNSNATAPAEVSENLVCNASAELEEKISQKQNASNEQPGEKFSKQQTSYRRHTNADFQQCSLQHQQPGPAAAPYTQVFQCTFGTWGYPVTSQMNNHLQKEVGDKSFVYETLNYSVVNNSVGNETVPETMLSPVPQSIPSHKLVQTEYPLICADQRKNKAILSSEVSADKNVSHSSAVKLGSSASGSGVLPRLDWARPVLRESSLPCKDNSSIKKYQWRDNSPRQTPDTKKQRFEAGEFTQAVCRLEEMSLVEFSGSCTLDNDQMALGESNAHQNGVRCANGTFTSTISTQNYAAPKISHIDEAEGAFFHIGNFGGATSCALPLFPVVPVLCPGKGSHKPSESENLQVSKVIKAVPRSAVAASESTAIILKSIQQERWLQG